MAIHIHQHDLPAGVTFGDAVAIDTETMGLNPQRDRLCVVQLSAGDGDAHLVQIASPPQPCPRLTALLANQNITKLFHFARFDIASLANGIGPVLGPIYCTKIASKLARTYTDRHGLKDLCRELLKIDISKQQQTSDWGAEELTAEQADYAAGDVLYFVIESESILMRCWRARNPTAIAAQCFAFYQPVQGLILTALPNDDIPSLI